MADAIVHKNDMDKKGRWAPFLLLFVPCILSLVRSLDNDIWFLLNHGRYVLESGIPHIEPFTIHQGFHFVMQQWLSASIFWLAYSSLGDIGVKLLVMLCYMLLVFVIFKLCMLISNNYFFISFSITLFVSIIFTFFMVSRPYIFSTLIFALEFYLLESYRKTGNEKPLLFLPLLSVFLINFQAATWPMLFIFLVPYVIETFKFKIGPFEGHGAEKKWLYPAILVSGAAGFLNPYGFEAMVYLFKSYGYESVNAVVGEMNPVNINEALGKIAILCIVIVPVIYCSYKKGVKRLRYILLAMGTAYMTMSSYRNLFLFALCAYFPFADFLKDFEMPVKQNDNPKKTYMIRYTLIVLIIMLIPLGIYGGNEAAKPRNQEYTLLNETIDYIYDTTDANDVVLYTGYDAGGMAEFRGIRAYLDPRAEVFVKKNNKKADIFEEYVDLQRGAVFYKDVLDKYNFSHILLTSGDILYNYLPHDSGYRLEYSNEKYSLYVPSK